jgi:hypothetical protein
VTKIHEEIICHMEEMDELQVKLGEATTNNWCQHYIPKVDASLGSLEQSQQGQIMLYPTQ